MSAIKHVGSRAKEFLKNGATSITKPGGFKVAGAFAICAAIGVGFASTSAESSSMDDDLMSTFNYSEVMEMGLIADVARAMPTEASSGHFDNVDEPSDNTSLSDEQRAEVEELVKSIMAKAGQEPAPSSPATLKMRINLVDVPGEMKPDVTLKKAHVSLESCMQELNRLAPGKNKVPDTEYGNKNNDWYACIPDAPKGP
jgi:hypothetical protein